MARATGYALDANYHLLFRELGVQPADVLRRAGLPDDLLARSAPVLSPQQWFAFWEALEAETGGEHFVLQLIDALGMEMMSPPVFAALCSPSMTIAAQRLRDYKRLCAPMRIDVDLDDEALTITFHWLNTADVPPASLMGFEVAFFTWLARTGLRDRVVPLRVASERPPADAEAFEAFLGVPIEHGERPSMTFSRADADRPFLTANASMWSAFEPELRRRLADIEENASVTERVCAVLLESLPSGQTSMEAVAKRLAMSKRTLQRRLNEEGTTFMTQLSGTREKLALHYLQRTRYTCTEIAFLLGFEEPSSFFRAFHEWTGVTPESLREQLNVSAPA